MKKINRILTLCCLLTLIACSNNKHPKEDVITIDLLKAIKNTETFYLSDIVDDVEYVKFETTPDCGFGLARYLITDNHIIVYEQYYSKILIFDRKGKFIRKFGQKGKGPGEMTVIENVIAFQDEDFLMVQDMSSRKVIKFSMEGKLIEERTFTSPDINELAKISLVGPDRFALVFKRPVSKQLNYPMIHIYNKNFELVDELYFVNTENQKSGSSSRRHSIYMRNNKIHFREHFFDTLYIYDGNQFNPKYYFQVKHNSLESYSGRNRSSAPTNEIWDQFEIGNYLICNMDMPTKNEGEYIGKWILFNKSNQEILTLTDLPWYFRNDLEPEPAIYNNIDGIFHIYMNEYTNHLKTHVTENLIYKATEIFDLKEYIDNDHQLEHDVVFPDKQKELIDLIKNSSENDNPILQIFHLKK